jgi:hypothetical protein
MNAMNYNKSFTKLKITEAVTSDGSLYGDTYKASVNNPATADEAIRDMAAQIRDNEGLMRVIIGDRAVELIKQYNNE